MRGCGVEVVVVRMEAVDPAAEVEGEVRPLHGVAPVGIQIPARAAARVPDAALEALLDVGVPAGLSLLSHLERVRAAFAHRSERLEHVVDLRLEHVHDGGVSEVQVGPVEQEQVGEAYDGGSEICMGTAGQDVRQSTPVAAYEPSRDRRVGGAEASSAD